MIINFLLQGAFTTLKKNVIHVKELASPIKFTLCEGLFNFFLIVRKVNYPENLNKALWEFLSQKNMKGKGFYVRPLKY